MLLRLVSAALLVAEAAQAFTACETGSKCAEWVDLMADSAKTVTIEERVKGASAEYYHITIKGGAEDSVKVVKFRRYSEFDKLKKALGEEAPGDFPEKLWWNWAVSKLAPSKLEERRVGLETWLRAVLSHDSAKGAWADDLFTFLDPMNSIMAVKSGISMLPTANKICNEDIHYFGIDLGTGAEKVRVWRRYSDFYAFYTDLESKGLKDDMTKAQFPPKIFWNKVLKMWERMLEDRRAKLEAWLQEVKLLADSASGGVYHDTLTKFLDPMEAKSKIAWDCFTEDTAAAVYQKMTGLFGSAKKKG
jgi:hypothetical protein